MPHSDKHNSPGEARRTDDRDQNVDETLKEDLDPEAQKELEDRAETGSTVRAEEPEEGRHAEYGHAYMGRQMDDDLQSSPRPESEDDTTEED